MVLGRIVNTSPQFNGLGKITKNPFKNLLFKKKYRFFFTRWLFEYHHRCRGSPKFRSCFEAHNCIFCWALDLQVSQGIHPSEKWCSRDVAVVQATAVVMQSRKNITDHHAINFDDPEIEQAYYHY